MALLDKVQFYPLGDSAVTVVLGETIQESTHQRVRQLVLALEAGPLPGVVDCVPAFTSVTVHYDAVCTSYTDIVEQLQSLLLGLSEQPLCSSNVVIIPVCYGGVYGPDLSFVADHNGITQEDVVRIHTGSEYLVYMIGFAPGFPYLGGMSTKIAAPRQKTPRPTIPAGSVGIAGEQTGVYPMSTPGGWQLIGRTPIPLFQPSETPPTLLKAGDVVRFEPISESAFAEWGGRHSS